MDWFASWTISATLVAQRINSFCKSSRTSMARVKVKGEDNRTDFMMNLKKRRMLSLLNITPERYTIASGQTRDNIINDLFDLDTSSRWSAILLIQKDNMFITLLRWLSSNCGLLRNVLFQMNDTVRCVMLRRWSTRSMISKRRTSIRWSRTWWQYSRVRKLASCANSSAATQLLCIGKCLDISWPGSIWNTLV